MFLLFHLKVFSLNTIIFRKIILFCVLLINFLQLRWTGLNKRNALNQYHENNLSMVLGDKHFFNTNMRKSIFKQIFFSVLENIE